MKGRGTELAKRADRSSARDTPPHAVVLSRRALPPKARCCQGGARRRGEEAPAANLTAGWAGGNAGDGSVGEARGEGGGYTWFLE